MNYRHAYHAGNFADCFKHALLVALLDSFARKPTPYFVLDTHAGAGGYDLDADPAQRTGEADSGIRRLVHSTAPELARYLGLVRELGLYPGSPALIRAVLRENDRLACCELHPEDAAALRRRFRRDPQVEVHERSGWEALTGLLPPKEKRGLVFVDPPFEAKDEFQMLVDGLVRGHERFRNGVFAAWYPIKQMAAVRGFYAGLRSSDLRDIITVELHLRDVTDPDRLNGCGLAVINPPYQFEEQALSIAHAVLDGVGDGEVGAGASVIRLADE
ncbi:MAG TPA: 23S rRNA (adenine(2030)-N(6))-methyltransferase RlmJ [Acetobacteraceae bacterium]|jgi:23S rRNA (adenine2030-N6)-methyltransferase|nr:23S rRNA (adenine(2030)-N(6))-methyltransferase RlmJ [Acetobacteraceae bacterium]